MRHGAQRSVALLVMALMTSAAHPASSQEESAQTPQFRAGVSQVRVDVVVTDDDGEFVSDLGPADFLVREDGQIQEILQVELVDLIAGRVTTVAGAYPEAGGGSPAPPVPDPRDSGTDLPRAEIEPGDYGAMVFVIQGGRLGYWERRRFAKGWVELLESTGEYTFPRAVFAIGYRGQLTQLTPLTYDVDQLRDVSTQLLDSIYGRESGSGSSAGIEEAEDPALEEARGSRRSDPGEQIPGRRAALDFSYLNFVFDEDVGAVATLEALTTLCRFLHDGPGRKAIVWVSEGILLTQTGRSADAMEELQQAANSARVSIYTVDPAMVTKRSIGGADLFGIDPEVSVARARRRGLGYTTRGQSNDDFRDSLVAAATETGGKSYTYQPRVERALRDIERDSSRFYLLTYRPPRIEGDDMYHDIEVEVLRPDLEMRARKGYIHRSSVQQKAFNVGTASQLIELPVVAGAFYRWDVDGKPHVQVGVDIERLERALGRAAGFLPTSQEEEPTLQIYFGAIEEMGRAVGRFHESVTRRVPSPPNSPSVYLREWEIGYGRFNFYVMVFDETSGRQGRSWFQVEIPNPANSWRASQPILVRQNRAGSVDPILDGKATEGTAVQVFLEIFGAHEPVLWARVLAENGGRELPQFSAELVEDEESGIATAFLNLPVRLAPGSYTIQLSMSDPLVKGAANFDIPLEIVPKNQ